MRSLLRIGGVILLLSIAAEARGQLINTATPFQNIGSSFFENTGVRWSLRGPNFFANFGGGPPLLPAFGNADPNAGLRTGFGTVGGGLSGSLGFNFAQGSSRSITSTTPSVTTLNGYPGTISSQTISPFVTGVTPVVGRGYGQPAQDNASQQMFSSHQQTQAKYLQSRQLAAAHARQKKAEEAFTKAARAEEDGNLKMARANYRKALSYDQGPLRLQIMQRLQARGWK